MPRYNFFFPWHSLLRFRALRPTPASAPRVAAVPHDVVNAAGSPCAGERKSPEFSACLARGDRSAAEHRSLFGRRVIAKAVENFAALKTQAPLVDRGRPEPVSSIASGWGATRRPASPRTFSIDEYDRDVIKKHERTRRDKEDDRTRHMIELRRADRARVPDLPRSVRTSIASWHARRAATPLFDFTAPDGVQHTIWRVDRADVTDLVAAFDAIPRSTSPTDITAPPAPHARDSSCAALTAVAANGIRCWRSRFPTTRCRCCRTTAS